MKQITLETAQKLACRENLKLEIEYCQIDWIRNNARHIAMIETKQTDKTLFGEWPKGWKHEMKLQAEKQARQDLLARFLRDQCKELDGAIWLGNWQMIQELERKSA